MDTNTTTIELETPAPKAVKRKAITQNLAFFKPEYVILQKVARECDGNMSAAARRIIREWKEMKRAQEAQNGGL